MRTILLFGLSVLLGQQIYAQGCNELFISEYCEGSGNNKAIEIYNPTPDPIDLAPYVIERWSNGDNFAGDELDLQGSIPGYGTWVIVNGQTEDVDLGGGNISPACDPIMQDLADQLDNPYPAPTYMNGNDAIILVKNGDTPVDIFGQPAEDPGIAWTDNADAGYSSADGGAWLTANQTLRRKWIVTSGVTAPPGPGNFYALAEYDSLPNNTWDGLGMHACSCDPNSVDDTLIDINMSVGPNPSTDGMFTVQSNVAVERIQAFSQNGQLVLDDNVAERLEVEIDLRDAMSGMFIVNVYLENGSVYSYRVVKK